jgi:hypothetical protein
LTTVLKDSHPLNNKEYDIDDNKNWILTTYNLESMKEKLLPGYWERLQVGVHAIVRVNYNSLVRLAGFARFGLLKGISCDVTTSDSCIGIGNKSYDGSDRPINDSCR